MLITFSSAAYPDITMFGSNAQELLKMMGFNDLNSGSIPAKDIPKVVARLEKALAAVKKPVKEDQTAKAGNNNEGEPAVGLAQRALPLIEFLNVSAKKEANVTWKQSYT